MYFSQNFTCYCVMTSIKEPIWTWFWGGQTATDRKAVVGIRLPHGSRCLLPLGTPSLHTSSGLGLMSMAKNMTEFMVFCLSFSSLDQSLWKKAFSQWLCGEATRQRKWSLLVTDTRVSLEGTFQPNQTSADILTAPSGEDPSQNLSAKWDC